MVHAVPVENVLIVGTGKLARYLQNKISGNPWLSQKVVGCLELPSAAQGNAGKAGATLYETSDFGTLKELNIIGPSGRDAGHHRTTRRAHRLLRHSVGRVRPDRGHVPPAAGSPCGGALGARYLFAAAGQSQRARDRWTAGLDLVGNTPDRHPPVAEGVGGSRTGHTHPDLDFAPSAAHRSGHQTGQPGACVLPAGAHGLEWPGLPHLEVPQHVRAPARSRRGSAGHPQRPSRYPRRRLSSQDQPGRTASGLQRAER